MVVGGGILILLILAFLHGSLSPGGFLNTLGGGFSKAIAGAGSASLDVGPFHNSVAGAGSFNAGAGGGLNNGFQVGGGRLNDPQFNQNVANSVNRHF